MHPGWASCKGQRLCALFDRSTIELLAEGSGTGKCAVEDAERVQAALSKGHFGATRHASTLAFPQSPAEFEEQLVSLHGAIFEPSGFDFGGRFRVGHEHVEFGGSYQHRMVGADPSDIPQKISELGVKFFRGDPQSLNREEFIQQAAWFLGEFFRVHPFRDGNGRVARLMLAIAGNASDTVRLGVWGGDGRSRRRYIKALQFAHKASNKTASLGPLMAYLRHVILERDLEEFSEAEPPTAG